MALPFNSLNQQGVQKIENQLLYILHCVQTWLNNFDVHVTMHRDKFLIIKPTRCSNFSNLFFEGNSTCFRQFLCSSSDVFHCTHSSGICHTGFADCLLVGASKQSAKPVWHIPLLCVQWKTYDDGQRNCLKHVEFPSKNKFEKLVHLVGFIIRKMAEQVHLSACP